MESLTKSAVKWRTNKQKGMCCACGKCPPLPGLTLCADCKENELYGQAAYRLRHRDDLRAAAYAKYWDRVAKGLCVTCGKVPPQKGRRRCLRCAAQIADACARGRRRKLYANENYEC